MASFHLEIKRGLKGTAKQHARYIARKGKHEALEDIVDTGFGNMPDWAANDPDYFWDVADHHERKNGAAYREYVIAIPNEFNEEQQATFVARSIQGLVGSKPYQYAIHTPLASLGAVENAHTHVMFSDRAPDGISRPPEQMFSRYNPQHPERGGNRKASGGLTRLQLRERVTADRKFCADLQNDMLRECGSDARVDHRSYKERGIARQPERHLGPARIKKMAEVDKADYLLARETPVSPLADAETDSVKNPV